VTPPPVVRHPKIRGAYMLLMGERRWAAAVREGGPLIVYRLDDWFDLHAWMIFDSQTQYGPGHEPMRLSSAAAMVDRIKALTSPPARGNVDAIMAEYIGDEVTRKRIQHIRQTLVLKGLHGPEIDALIDKEVNQSDLGIQSTDTTYARVHRAIDRLSAPPVSAAQQRKILNNSAQIGAGIIDGLSGLGPALDDTLTPGECAVYQRQLAAVRLKLEQVIRQLKERTR
jgi:hypothetical protein